jgi:Bax protein
MLSKINLNKRYIALFFVLGLIVFCSLNTVKFFNQDGFNSSSVKELTKLELTLNNNIPDFSSFKDVKVKKSTFFEFIYPMVVNSNINILKERDFIQNSDTFGSVALELCKKYRIKCNKDNFKTLFIEKVNIIPPSLALAQAANESSWGTSRFARKANNYFGEWCFTKGCGLVPSQRNDNQTHEVEKFETVFYSVKSYLHNLNSHPAYEELRVVRNNESFSGLSLSKGLSKYSERGHEYIKEINSMINYNKLTKYDTKMKEHLKLNINI